MTQVGIQTLKAELSKYVRLANAGERIVVMDRGRPVAVLSGIREEEEVRQAWDLVDAGLANWKGGKPKGSADPVKVRGKTVAEMVIEDRR
jgi:prevent-host-death family protein